MKPENFQREIDWMKAHIKRQFGITTENAVLEPYTERWFFYTSDARLVATVPHELVETLYGLFLLEESRKALEKKNGNGAG